MIYTFPTPYPDELLYSVLARYHVRSGNTSPKMTIEDLFGKRTVRSVWDLPSSLNALLRNTGTYWDAEQLLFNYTMYPYYATFLFPSQAIQVKQSMMRDKGGSIHNRIGITASNVKTKDNFWVCSDCIKEDMAVYGETYWRRVHQCPGVFICPKHETILEETIVSVKSSNQHEYIVATSMVARTKININGLKEDEIELLIKIAKMSHALLTNTQLPKTDNTLRKKYLELLMQRQFATPNGRVKRERLYHSFKATFTERCLELLQSGVEFEDDDWLFRIFRKHHKSFHPIRHLLVILFLDIDLDHLFDKNKYQPFGKGPWLCLNPACPNFQKPVVKDLKITIDYNSRKPVGTFSCKCGFVFSRRGPDKNKDDIYHIGTIKEYGHVWKGRLAELVNKGAKLTEISAMLHADRATIKKYAVELQLKVPWKPPKTRKSINGKLECIDSKLIDRKNKWLELQKLYPEKTKTELQRMAPEVYYFLYRNDKDWLNEFSPKRNRTQPPNHRVDWKKRDEVMLKAIKKLIENWDADDAKPTRITLYSLGKKLNANALLDKNPDKLPKTITFISTVSEDITAFQKRRVEYWIVKLKEQGEPITKNKIYRKAGLNSPISAEVKRLVSIRVMEYETALNNNK